MRIQIKVTQSSLLPLLAAVGALLASSAQAMDYSPPGPYELTVNGTYEAQDNQFNNAQNNTGISCTGSSPGTCSYIPADFAYSTKYPDPETGLGTTYGFTFTIAPGATDYFNMSYGDGLELFSIQEYTCSVSGTGCGTQASFAGPLSILDNQSPNGFSLAFSADGAAVNYYVAVTLANGDDPTNDISLTSSALGAVVTATPLPAALPLFATGFGALGLLGWRRKRKNTAA
ncbi:MAG TPA: VPLPA-CTERM sorting domain-containing protein [Xanthobacteraceae bacterium]|nr:VPLPA-CTERM sorting domain-containing protein [Xanthobacteraceae bacterium]